MALNSLIVQFRLPENIKTLPNKETIMKNITLLTLLIVLSSPIVHAAPSDSQRITELEHRVAELTEQVNHLLADRWDDRHDYHRNRNYPVYSCSLTAFTETYRAQSSNRGKARLDVANQCRAKHNAMFCEEKAVTCETYQ